MPCGLPRPPYPVFIQSTAWSHRMNLDPPCLFELFLPGFVHLPRYQRGDPPLARVVFTRPTVAVRTANPEFTAVSTLLPGIDSSGISVLVPTTLCANPAAGIGRLSSKQLHATPPAISLSDRGLPELPQLPMTVRLCRSSSIWPDSTRAPGLAPGCLTRSFGMGLFMAAVVATSRVTLAQLPPVHPVAPPVDVRPVRARQDADGLASLDTLLTSLPDAPHDLPNSLFDPQAGSLTSLSPELRSRFRDLVRRGLLTGMPKQRLPTPTERETAHGLLDQADRVAPGHPVTSYVSGLLATHIGDWPAAEQGFSRSLRLSPAGQPGAGMGLLLAQLSLGREEDARATSRDLADWLTAEAGRDSPPDSLPRIARWLGRASTCWPVDPAGPLPVLTWHEFLRGRLSPHLHASYDAGADELRSEQDELRAWVDLPVRIFNEHADTARTRLSQTVETLRDSEQVLIADRRAKLSEREDRSRELARPLIQAQARISRARWEIRPLMQQIRVLQGQLRVSDPVLPPLRRRSRSEREREDLRWLLETERCCESLRIQLQQELARLQSRLDDRLREIELWQGVLQSEREVRVTYEREQRDLLGNLVRDLHRLRSERGELQRSLRQPLRLLESQGELQRWIETPSTWLSLNIPGQRQSLSDALRRD